MCSRLDDNAVTQHSHLITASRGIKAMCNYQGGWSSRRFSFLSREYASLGDGIKVRRRLIEQQNLGPLREGASQRDALPLATTQL
mmetsp:Transcript_5138/g.12954  ORF Transcript_5138/g.12954 Transcript_5138/m.12954 type:complete len:85 (+) Transcript_5138:160-414(+)